MTQPSGDKIIEVLGLQTYFGKQCVHSDVNLTVYTGEIIAIVGGSGSGKTTLLRDILMLEQPTAGQIKLFDTDVQNVSPNEQLALQQKIGMMFQRGALFSSLTVLENVALPLQLHSNLAQDAINELACLKIAFVGLPINATINYPSELSGGMIKRVALARAIAMDPPLLFLDEPTAGLDPKSASDLEDLILSLRTSLGLTIVIVTHDLDTLWRVADRVAFLGDGKILQTDTMEKLSKSEHPMIHAYFANARAQAARRIEQTDEVH